MGQLGQHRGLAGEALGVLARRSRSTLSATRAPVAASRARYTVPMPPAPAVPSTAKRPATTTPTGRSADTRPALTTPIARGDACRHHRMKEPTPRSTRSRRAARRAPANNVSAPSALTTTATRSAVQSRLERLRRGSNPRPRTVRLGAAHWGASWRLRHDPACRRHLIPRRPSRMRPRRDFWTPPHCLKKNDVRVATHCAGTGTSPCRASHPGPVAHWTQAPITGWPVTAFSTVP